MYRLCADTPTEYSAGCKSAGLLLDNEASGKSKKCTCKDEYSPYETVS